MPLRILKDVKVVIFHTTQFQLGGQCLSTYSPPCRFHSPPRASRQHVWRARGRARGRSVAGRDTLLCVVTLLRVPAGGSSSAKVKSTELSYVQVGPTVLTQVNRLSPSIKPAPAKIEQPRAWRHPQPVR